MTTKAEILAKANELVAMIESWKDGEQPPLPTLTKTFTVKAGSKALARFVYSHNDAGKPIMQIYPGDSITTERIKYTEGQRVEVFPALIRSDGGGDYYEIAVPPIPVRLYLRAVDGVLS